MDKKVTIIGGGVAGASTAIKLAEKLRNPNVIRLIDKNSSFNKACSGILTFAVDDLIKIPDEIIVSKVKRFRIHAPSGEFLELEFKRPDIVCEREKLNQHLNNVAQEKGVHIYRPASLETIENNNVIIKQDNKLIKLPTTHLVGADGSQSSVAKKTNIFGQRNFFVGAKAIIEKEHEDTIDVFPNYGCFGWAVPHGKNKVEVGTMSYTNQGAVFDKFMKKFKDYKVISKEGALIPIYNPKLTTQTIYGNMNVYLVGDAATMVKATTGGSIIQSFIASNFVSDSIINDAEYTWKSKLGIELWTHLKIRKILDKFSEKDWNQFIHLFQDIKVKEILETKTRDYPTMMVLKLLLAKPSLLKFVKKMF